LLQTMPVAAGAAFVILFFAWFIMMRRHKPAAQS
jgi:predicted permease